MEKLSYSPSGLPTWYNYINQAWVVDGVYADCGHTYNCNCFGHLHQGEEPDKEAKSV